MGSVKVSVRWVCGVAMCAYLFVVGCSGGSSNPVRPTVASTVPADQAMGAALNVVLSATFDTDMDDTTIDATTFTLAESVAGTPVTGTVAYSAPTRTATFTPDADLTASMNYTATLTTGITNSSGVSFGADFTWSFDSGTAPDITPPMVVSTDPVDTAAGIAVGANITATFDESINLPTISATTFTVTGGGAVTGTVSYNDATLTATFNPTSNLTDFTTYTATLTTEVQDQAANGLTSDEVWTFTTADGTPPTVTAQSPAAGQVDVTLNTTVTATFSENMDVATVDDTTFTLANGGAVAGTVTYDAPSRTATFTSSGNLVANTVYTATVTTGALDLAGNGLTSLVSWQFTTTNDVTPPSITGQYPKDVPVDTNVPGNRAITVTFDEDMEPTSLDEDTEVALVVDPAGARTPVTITPVYDVGTRTVTLSHADLTPGSAYEVTLFGTVTDLTGNSLAGADVTWIFWAAANDVTDPSVISWSPGGGSTDVSVATHQEITFSEPMDRASVEAAFSITPTPLHAPWFFWNATGDMVTVVFDTTNPPGVEGDDILAENQAYNVQVAATAQDLAGRTLPPSGISWTTQVDITAPQVLSTMPSLSTTLDAATQTLVVTFDESMDTSFVDVGMEDSLDNDERQASLGLPDFGLSLSWTSATELTLDLSGSPLLVNTVYSIEIVASDAAGNLYDPDVELFLVTTGTDRGSVGHGERPARWHYGRTS